MTLTPVSIASWAKSWSLIKALDPLGILCDLVRNHPLRNIHKPLLGKMRDEARVCTMVHDTGRGVFPVFGQLDEFHLPVVQGLLVRARGQDISVGIPRFYGGVDVEDVVVMAPLHDLAAVDIPCNIDQEATG